ncbi:hypothetical protein [Granulicella tundricola]|uniref:Uncharacterized protein n=1 Tax=Granulicella tundricola (strain ATCC BAA-1859 / DSM 23138 / MP5ACTX9) TaxID=1198114 RepID=E8X2P3_GRATM|nr:hypothetical protein [Granulicella tundricola]ADW70340.1 hypothetical protein AciX9_3331 [Granulicella tundricola MP5ACTX9]
MAKKSSAGEQEPAALQGAVESVIMSLRVDKPQHDRLRKLAFDKRIPMREFIVRGIEEVLKAEKY